jgi:hypothetical protein
VTNLSESKHGEHGPKANRVYIYVFLSSPVGVKIEPVNLVNIGKQRTVVVDRRDSARLPEFKEVMGKEIAYSCLERQS